MFFSLFSSSLLLCNIYNIDCSKHHRALEDVIILEKLFIKALDHLENGKFEESAAEFLDSRWAKQVGGRALELSDLIKTGEYVE